MDLANDNRHNTESFNGYKAVDRIGVGRSTVLKAVDDSGGVRAIKIFNGRPPGDAFDENQQRIISVMSTGFCRSFARVFSTGRESRGYQFLVMEYVEGSKLRKFDTEAQAIQCVIEFCTEIANLRDLDIVLRWMEPNDFLVEESKRLRLIDNTIFYDKFDMAKRHELVPRRDPSLLSPESIQGKRVGPQASTYALAALTVYVCVGCSPVGPFDREKGTSELAARISSSKKTILPFTDKRLRDLLKSCLEQDPDRRPYLSASEFRQALEECIESV